MARKPRIEFPHAFHHVIVRGNQRQKVFLFGRSRASAINAYFKFVRDGMKEGHREDYYRLKDQRILGEDEFAEDLIKKTEGWQGCYWNAPVREIIKKACGTFGADALLLKSVGRGRRISNTIEILIRKNP